MRWITQLHHTAYEQLKSISLDFTWSILSPSSSSCTLTTSFLHISFPGVPCLLFLRSLVVSTQSLFDDAAITSSQNVLASSIFLNGRALVPGQFLCISVLAILSDQFTKIFLKHSLIKDLQSISSNSVCISSTAFTLQLNSFTVNTWANSSFHNTKRILI